MNNSFGRSIDTALGLFRNTFLREHKEILAAHVKTWQAFKQARIFALRFPAGRELNKEKKSAGKNTIIVL